MARLAAATLLLLRPPPCALAAVAALAVCAFYYAGSGGPAPGEAELHVLLVLAKAERSAALRAKAEAALRSLVHRAELAPRQTLALHLLSDAPSKALGQELLRAALRGAPFASKVGARPSRRAPLRARARPPG